MKRLLIRRVVGHSMLPTLKQGQIIVALKKSFKKGDIVVAWMAGREVVKRVTYFDDTSGRVLLKGDNAADSTDSRQLGPVTSEVIAGVMVWPKR